MLSRYSLLMGVSLVCLVWTPALSARAQMSEETRLKPRMDVGAQMGNKRTIFATELWMPLAQKYDRVLYADARLMGDNRDNQEGNFGVGYRVMNESTNSVLGVHGWIDRRSTQNNSRFNQFTFGGESLGHDWDVRANGYVPLNQGKIIGAAGTTDPYLAGTGLFYDVNGFLVETPQYGVDAEIGYRLPILQNKADTIRVFGGGYHFFRNQTENVSGFRVRSEAQINGAFSVGARFQYDQPRGAQGFVEIKLRFPFDSKKEYQQDKLRARLDESPERDVDIVTASTSQPGTQQVAVQNVEEGTAQRVIHVDNSNADLSGGDGSFENPFTTLKAAEAVLQDNDVLYVNHGTGTTLGMDEGVIIDHDNILLIGSGSDFVWDNGRYTSSFGGAMPTTGSIIAAATVAPVITNTDVPIDAADLYTGSGVLVNGMNGFVTGLTVDGAQGHGVYLTEGGVVANVSVDNSARDGIRALIANDADTIVIRDNIVSQSGSANITVSIRSQANSVVVRNNDVSSSTNSHGIVVASDGAAAFITDVDVHDNVSDNNAREGIWVFSTVGGSIENIRLSNNIATGSQDTTGVGNGIRIQSWTDGFMGNVTLVDNETADNGNSGLYILTGNNGLMQHLTVTGHQSYQNNQNGVYVQQVNAVNGIESSIFSNNDVYENTYSGFRFHYSANAPYKQGEMGGGSAESIGYNRVYNNGTWEMVLTNATVSAQHNWWGSATGLDPLNVTFIGSSTIDANNWLTVDPRP